MSEQEGGKSLLTEPSVFKITADFETNCLENAKQAELRAIPTKLFPLFGGSTVEKDRPWEMLSRVQPCGLCCIT